MLKKQNKKKVKYQEALHYKQHDVLIYLFVCDYMLSANTSTEFNLHVCLQFVNSNRVDLFHSLLRVPGKADPPAGTELSTDGRDRAQ